MTNITLSKLLAARVHLGHKTRHWNAKMFPYIYKELNNIHILDLIQSKKSLKKANKYIEDEAKKGKTFLFIGTKYQVRNLIANEAKRCNSFYVNYRWLGGMLTNWSTLKIRIKYLQTLEKQELNNTFLGLTKKEINLKQKKLKKLRYYFDGIKNMSKLPDIAIIIDQPKEMTAIKECKKLQIPIISILDTNCNPDLIDIPIFGNDDSLNSIQLILKSLANSIIKGKLK